MLKNPIIQVRNITVRYGDTTVLENVSFDVYKGEIFVIVGGSGCGKSTLLRQIIGLEKPTEGTILIDGKDITKAQGKERQEILKNFGILFQSSGLFASMTLAENISLVLKTFTELPEERIIDVIDLKLKAVGLGGYEDYLPSEISGGMKKRAALARAMALDPLILCFDEPSSGLDPITAASLDNLIIELNSAIGITMLVVTHDIASIMKISHRVVMLDKEKKGIVAEGKPEELKHFTNNILVYNFFNRLANN